MYNPIGPPMSPKQCIWRMIMTTSRIWLEVALTFSWGALVTVHEQCNKCVRLASVKTKLFDLCSLIEVMQGPF